MFTGLPRKFAFIFLVGIGVAFLMAGIGAGLWLLTRPAKALRRLTLPPEQRRREAEAAAHPLARLSLRGKEAWLICCLEQALTAFGLDTEPGRPGSWHPLLALLGELPGLPEEEVEDWLDRMAEILPSSILAPDPGPAPGNLSLGEQRHFATAWALYAAAGPRMALLGPLIELPVRLVRENREDPALRPDLALALLDEARELLESYGVPLPGADVRDFLLARGSPGMGKPFSIAEG